MSLTIISYGGGVQSTAMLVLANRGELAAYEPEVALFSNVGDDSEMPQTVDYVRNWAAVVSAIPVVETQRTTRDGTPQTLHERLLSGTKNGRVSDLIPLYTPEGVPMSRGCTADHKIRPIGKWLKAHGASAENPATVCIGISTDEIHRVNRKRVEPYERPVYPLIELGLDRSRCAQLIEEAGWPNPGKSSCYFCPFHRPQMWAEMRRDEPQLFDLAADLEAHMNRRRIEQGREAFYLTRFGKPLGEAIPEAQDTIPGLEGAEWPTCDEGACWV
jgi:hypothetical protein